MSVSDGYRTYIVEQLAALPALSTRRMFGGIGLYSGEWFFALIDDDVLFFKVDDANRDDYVSRGMKAFMPFPGQAEPGLLPGAGGGDRRSGGTDALGAALGRGRAARRNEASQAEA